MSEENNDKMTNDDSKEKIDETLMARLNSMNHKERKTYLKELDWKPENPSKLNSEKMFQIIQEKLKSKVWDANQIHLAIDDAQFMEAKELLVNRKFDDYSQVADIIGLKTSIEGKFGFTDFLDIFRKNLRTNSDLLLSLKKYYPPLEPSEIFIQKESKKTRDLIKEVETKLVITLTGVLKAISNLNSRLNQVTTDISNLQQKVEEDHQTSDFSSFLGFVHKESANLQELEPKFFSDLQIKMKQEGLSNNEIINNSITIASLAQVINLVKQLSWDIPMEEFFQVIKESHKQHATPLGSAVIRDIRKDICARYNISNERFNEKLIKGREKNWFVLTSGSPLNDPNPEFLEVGSNKFYYLKLKRIK